MTELRLLDPNGYLVPGTITTVSDGAADEIRDQLLEKAAEHAAQWADFGYHAGDYRVA
ncbi:hypothetical protein ACWGH4_00015 [Streptomyces sp. NPDC054847]